MRGGFGHRITSDANEDFSLKNIDNATIKFWWNYLLRYKKKLLFAILSMLVVTISSLASPILIKIAVDNYIMQNDKIGLNWIFIALTIIFGVNWLFNYFQTYLSNWIGQGIVEEIRKDLFIHLQNLSMNFYSKRKTGETVSIITNDINALSDLLSTGFIHFVNDFLTLIGIIIIMILLDLQLALISFISIPIILFLVSSLGHRMRNAYKEVREKLAALNADVEENLSGIRLVQALKREKLNTKKFKKLSWENLKINLKAASYFALLFPIMALSKVLGETLVLFYGGMRVVEGTLSLGVLLAFLIYVVKFFSPIAELSQVYNTYLSAGAALDRIYHIMKIEPSIKEIKNPIICSKKSIKGSIEFRDVNFGYDETPIISNFNLNIKPNEVFGLIGRTGAGKTTLIKLLTRLYDPDNGKILIDGKEITKLSLNSLRSIISIVPQNVFLFDMTIKDNIKYGRMDATMDEIMEITKRINAHDFIKNLPKGYNTKIGERGVKLSEGQKQLVSFARALLVDPKILILDEATSSVDVYTEKLIKKAMEVLVKDRTVILIAHRFSTLMIADRIGVLKDGNLNDIGTHQELLDKNPFYWKMYKKQIRKPA